MAHETVCSIMVGVGAVLAYVAPVGAQVFHSIDADCDLLLRIDATTGDVQVVGALGSDHTVQLTLHQDTLYGLHYELGVSTDLLTIDTQTGAVTATTTVTRAGADVAFAEGLASVNDLLMIGFNTSGSCCQSRSHSGRFVEPFQ